MMKPLYIILKKGLKLNAMYCWISLKAEVGNQQMRLDMYL